MQPTDRKYFITTIIFSQSIQLHSGSASRVQYFDTSELWLNTKPSKTWHLYSKVDILCTILWINEYRQSYLWYVCPVFFKQYMVSTIFTSFRNCTSFYLICSKPKAYFLASCTSICVCNCLQCMTVNEMKEACFLWWVKQSEEQFLSVSALRTHKHQPFCHTEWTSVWNRGPGWHHEWFHEQ